MEINLKISGSVLIILALGHILFPRYFKWDEELRPLSLINRQMMYVHAFFIGIAVFMMGLLCVSSTTELIDTPLGREICLGLGVFWLLRLFFQFFVYSTLLWRGKKLETGIHILFSLIWVYLSLIFLMIGAK